MFMQTFHPSQVLNLIRIGQTYSLKINKIEKKNSRIKQIKQNEIEVNKKKINLFYLNNHDCIDYSGKTLPSTMTTLEASDEKSKKLQVNNENNM